MPQSRNDCECIWDAILFANLMFAKWENEFKITIETATNANTTLIFEITWLVLWLKESCAVIVGVSSIMVDCICISLKYLACPMELLSAVFPLNTSYYTQMVIKSKLLYFVWKNFYKSWLKSFIHTMNEGFWGWTWNIGLRFLVTNSGDSCPGSLITLTWKCYVTKSTGDLSLHLAK